MTAAHQKLLEQIVEMFEEKMQSLHVQLEGKINTISQVTSDQIQSLAIDVTTVRDEQSKKHSLIENEIISLSNTFIQADEKHTVCEIGLHAQIEGNNKLIREIEDSLRTDIDLTNKLVGEVEKRNSDNCTSLEELIKSELLIVSGDMDIKLSGVGGLLQEQVDLNKSAMESNIAELSATIIGTNETVRSMKLDLEQQLGVQAETIKGEIEAGIRVLKIEFHQTLANTERQIDEAKHLSEVVKRAQSTSAEESKQMCSAVRMETAERLSAIGIVFREEQAKTYSMLTQQLDTIRNNLSHHQLESRTTFEDHSARLTAASQNSESMIRAAQEENSKDIASLGEIFGNELACTIREIELKLTMSHDQLKFQIDSNGSSLETARTDFAAAVQDTVHNVEKVTSNISKQIQSLGAEIRSEHAAAFGEVNGSISAARAEFLVQIEENSKVVQNSAMEFAMFQEKIKETLESLEAKLSHDLLNTAKEIRSEKDSAFIELQKKIKAHQCEAKENTTELRLTVEKANLEIAASSEKAEVLIHSVRSDCFNELSAIRALVGQELAGFSEIADKKIVIHSESCQAQINLNRSEFETIASSLRAVVQSAATQFENSKLDFLKQTAALGSEVKVDIMSGFSRLDEKVAGMVKEQISTLQEIEERLTKSFSELQLQDVFLRKSVDENIEQIDGVQQKFQVLLNSAQEVAAQAIAVLEEKLQSSASVQEKMKEQMQSYFNELQLQIDAAREEVHNDIAEMAKTTAVSGLIESVKGEICQENCALIQQIKLDQETVIRDIKETVISTNKEMRLVTESNSKEIILVKKSSEMGLQMLQARLEECITSNGGQLEQLGKIYEEQVMLARQELQSQIDLCLLANNETMETIKQGLPLSHSVESKLLDSARSEWRIDILSASDELKLANSAMKVELGTELNQRLAALEEQLESGNVESQRLHSESCAQVNLQIVDTTVTLKNAMTSFDGRIDAVSRRTSQIEESVLKGAQSFAEYRQEIAQSFASLTKLLSEVQGQHAFCLTDIMQDKQELGELQLALGQIRSEMADLMKRQAEFLQSNSGIRMDSTELKCMRESELQGSIFSAPFGAAKAQDETNGNKEELVITSDERCDSHLNSPCNDLSGILLKDKLSVLDAVKMIEVELLKMRGSNEVSWQQHQEKLEALNFALNLLKDDHGALQMEVSKSAVQCSRGAHELAELKTIMSEVQEQHTLCVSNIMQYKQELSQAQFSLGQIQTDLDGLLKKQEPFVQDSEDTRFRNFFKKNGGNVDIVSIYGPAVDMHCYDIKMPAAYLDCLEKIDAIASILCSRVQTLLSEIWSLRGLQHHESQTLPISTINQNLAQDVDRISRSLADVQQQLCSSLSEMINERQEQLDMRLSFRDLSRTVKDIQKRIENPTDDFLASKNSQIKDGSSLGIALCSHEFGKVATQNTEESSSIMMVCMDDLHARLKALITNELANIRKELIESSKQANADHGHGSWVITKLTQSGAGLSAEPKLSEVDSIRDVTAMQEHGTVQVAARNKGTSLLSVGADEDGKFHSKIS
jgi:hypothetical protein